MPMKWRKMLSESTIFGHFLCKLPKSEHLAEGHLTVSRDIFVFLR